MLKSHFITYYHPTICLSCLWMPLKAALVCVLAQNTSFLGGFVLKIKIHAVQLPLPPVLSSEPRTKKKDPGQSPTVTAQSVESWMVLFMTAVKPNNSSIKAVKPACKHKSAFKPPYLCHNRFLEEVVTFISIHGLLTVPNNVLLIWTSHIHTHHWCPLKHVLL